VPIPNFTSPQVHFDNDTLLFANGSMLVLSDGSEITTDGARKFTNGTWLSAEGVEFAPPYIDTRTCPAVDVAHCGLVAPMSWWRWLWPFSGPLPSDWLWRMWPWQDGRPVESGWTLDGSIPVLYPRNDAELRWVVARASGSGCRLRPYDEHRRHVQRQVGELALGHERFYTVAVSMARYEPPLDWSLSGASETSLFANGIVRASAGASFFHVMQAVRPSGFMLASQPSAWTASSIGHMVTSMLHGNR
jgi:hypothetical protein